MAKRDLDLIYLCSEDARLRIKDAAVFLKKSPQRLKYALKTLEKEGMISSPYAIFDYSYFGLILFRVYFKGGYIGELDKTVILEKLGQNPYVSTIYELSGEFDLVIEMQSPNPSRFNKELKKLANLIPTLDNYKIVLNLVSHLYPRAYLLARQNIVLNVQPEIILGGDRAVENFRPEELKIMKIFLEHPKIRMTSLAKLAGLNVKTATAIFRNLQRRKIIRGFKYLIDVERLGVYKFRLIMKLHNLSQEREAQMMDLLLKTKEVVQVNKTVGDWDLEVDVESLEKIRIRHFITGLREEFKDIIEYFNVIEFYQYYERSCLPRYLFQES